MFVYLGSLLFIQYMDHFDNEKNLEKHLLTKRATAKTIIRIQVKPLIGTGHTNSYHSN